MLGILNIWGKIFKPIEFNLKVDISISEIICITRLSIHLLCFVAQEIALVSESGSDQASWPAKHIV